MLTTKRALMSSDIAERMMAIAENESILQKHYAAIVGPEKKKDELHLIDPEKRMLPCYSPMQQDVEGFEWGKGTGPSACIVLDN